MPAMTRARHWLKAARPLAQANIAGPLVLGQALAWSTTERFSISAALAVHAFGILDHLYIVFANDYADRDADVAGGQTLFSGGSGVLPSGQLRPPSLRRAAIAMALALFALGGAMAAAGRPGYLLAAALAVGLLWAYSYAPLRLSYRGGGEFLQALGLGVVLPALGYYGQAGDLAAFPVAALLPLTTLGFAGNITTALPDVADDRVAQKRTWAVRFSEPVARAASLIFIAVAVGLIVTSLEASPVARGAFVCVALAPLLVNLVLFRRAGSTNRRACLGFVFANGLALEAALLGWALVLVT